MIIGQILKPTEFGSRLFYIKGELENMLRSIRVWRSSGIDGNGIVPIIVLPLETKIESALLDVNTMINLVAQIKITKKNTVLKK